MSKSESLKKLIAAPTPVKFRLEMVLDDLRRSKRNPIKEFRTRGLSQNKFTYKRELYP